MPQATQRERTKKLNAELSATKDSLTTLKQDSAASLREVESNLTELQQRAALKEAELNSSAEVPHTDSAAALFPDHQYLLERAAKHPLRQDLP